MKSRAIYTQPFADAAVRLSAVRKSIRDRLTMYSDVYKLTDNVMCCNRWIAAAVIASLVLIVLIVVGAYLHWATEWITVFALLTLAALSVSVSFSRVASESEKTLEFVRFLEGWSRDVSYDKGTGVLNGIQICQLDMRYLLTSDGRTRLLEQLTVSASEVTDYLGLTLKTVEFVTGRRRIAEENLSGAMKMCLTDTSTRGVSVQIVGEYFVAVRTEDPLEVVQKLLEQEWMYDEQGNLQDLYVAARLLVNQHFESLIASESWLGADTKVRIDMIGATFVRVDEELKEASDLVGIRMIDGSIQYIAIPVYL